MLILKIKKKLFQCIFKQKLLLKNILHYNIKHICVIKFVLDIMLLIIFKKVFFFKNIFK